MAAEDRVQKSLLNARVNLLCYLAGLIVFFFTRRVLIKELGTEFIGLTGTLGSLLGFLNLAELGVATAMGYILYKPIIDKNRAKIEEIVSVFGFIYRRIGFLILGAGIILSAFLPLIFPDTEIPLGVIYLGFYALLSSSLIGYFINYRSLLLAADQRNYLVTGYFQLSKIAIALCQMLLALKFRNFYLYFILELLFGIINSIILNKKINKVYPWFNTEVSLGKKLFSKYPEVSKYVKQLFVHKLASFFQFQISPFLIYSFVSLPVVALYGNYTIITKNISSLITTVFSSTSSGIGNLVAEGDKKKIFSTFKELFSLNILCSGIASAAVYYLANPFISNWLGTEYQLSGIVVLLISINLFMTLLRSTTDQFINAFALFYDVWAPIIESLIFIACAIIAGSLWGLNGILLAPIISLLLIVHIWKPVFLYSKGFGLNPLRYFSYVLLHLLPLAAAYFGADALFRLIMGNQNMEASWLVLISGAALFVFLMTVLLLLIIAPLPCGLWPFLKRLLKLKNVRRNRA